MNTLEEFSDTNNDTTSEDENYLIEYNNINCKNVNNVVLEKDSESIYTLSKKTEIQNNKKIQFIKQMLNHLLKNFTFTESLIIHSIYNHNVKCFLIRNKTFKEYVLILHLLYQLDIKFTKTILENVFINVPIYETSKKYIKLKNEINDTFDFSVFKDNQYILDNKNTKLIPKLIKQYVNGFLFYLKNMVLLQHNYDIFIKEYDMTKNDLDNVTNIMLKNPSSSFCNDDNLKIISKWMTNKIKNLLIFNIYSINQKYPNTINIKKSFDTQIQILINIFLYIIILYNTPMILMKENFNKKKLETFLTFNYADEPIINNFINNKNLRLILKYIYEKKCKKNIFSSRKFVRIIYKYLL